ncbi:MAG: GNAT family N-acetyltransferase [Candidatus Saccharimonadales bacterium]
MDKELLTGRSEPRILRRGETARGELTIRTFVEGLDVISDLTKIIQRAWGAHEEVDGPKFKQVRQTDEQTAARVEHAEVLVAELDGMLVGLTAYYPPKDKRGSPPEAPPNAAYFPQDSTAEWGFMAIDPDAQGLGLSWEFYGAVEQLAAEDGVAQMVGRVRQDTPAVHDLYRRMGFEDIGTIPGSTGDYTLILISKGMTGGTPTVGQ